MCRLILDQSFRFYRPVLPLVSLVLMAASCAVISARPMLSTRIGLGGQTLKRAYWRVLLGTTKLEAFPNRALPPQCATHGCSSYHSVCHTALSIHGGSNGSGLAPLRNRTFSASKVDCDGHNASTKYRAYVAVGSNMGDRFGNIASALRLLCDPEWCSDQHVNVRVICTSFLYETAPMYVTDQPAFLNGAVLLETDLAPLDLLKRIKLVENELGRDFETARNGPRPVDLDILLYDSFDEEGSSPVVMDTPELTVPHPRIDEREFVLGPLCELGVESRHHPTLNVTLGDLFAGLKHSETIVEDEDRPVRVIPLQRGRMLRFNGTLIMGILNVTPDSFSDWGRLQGSVDLAVKQAVQMVQEGVDVIDVGGESTRPGAKEVAIEEEMNRTIATIRRIREVSPDVPISIDTRHAVVAREAVLAGADIVNDVSGGTFDPDMLPTVSSLQVPVVLMHMRGTPETMQTMTKYEDVVVEVASALNSQSCAAEELGISQWLHILDPGIGFAKDLQGNLRLLKRLGELRTRIHNMPVMLGTSRKGFIGKLSGANSPEDRDYGTIASCAAALCLGHKQTDCSILRVHDVKGAKQAFSVVDAIVNAK